MVKTLCASFACLLLLTCVAAANLPAGASPSAQATEPPPERPLYDPLGIASSDDPSISHGASPEQALAPSPELLSAQSIVAFNRMDGDNLNIYLYDTFSGATYMLTSGVGDNIAPHINPGLTRIAFASTRNGPAQQIFTMNLDGSNVMRVGTIEASSYNPAWSPDGLHIAFASTLNNTDGDIFTMDTNGSNILRLTNNAVYDDMPSWSPDGTRIAYVSYANSVYRVWVMKADGSGAQQLSQEPYSAAPVWSPDGSQIAYDADGDADGWQELWVMNADGSNRHQVYKPPMADTDAYMGSWNPGGSSLAFTQVEWVYINGDWYWSTASLACTSIITGGACFDTFGDAHWYPDWGSTDHLAPQTSMTALAEEVPYQFTVGWSGSDQGGAGIRTYDVQVKQGSFGAWSDWLLATSDQAAQYIGSGGQTYYFRTRASDNVGNFSPWPENYQSLTRVEAKPPRTTVGHLPQFARNSVRVYWYGLDAGDSGLRGFDLQYSDAQGGGWVAWLSNTRETSQIFTGSPGHTYYFRSRGTDNAGNVEDWPPRNGDAQVTLYNWLVDGTAMDILGAPLMGVEAAIAVGEAGSLPSDFEGHYTTYGTADVREYVSWVKDGYETLPLTMMDGLEDRGFDVFLLPNPNAVENPGFEQDLSGWQITGSLTTVNLPHTGLASARLGTPISFGENLQFEDFGYWNWIGGFQADPLGGLHALWKKDDPDNLIESIYYRYRDPSGAWTDIETVATLSFGNNPPPSLAVTPDGIAHVFFTENGTLSYTYRVSLDNWSPPEVISGDYWAGNDRSVGVEHEGELHLAWVCNVDGYGQVCYSRRSAEGVWDVIVQLTDYSNTNTYPVQMVVQNDKTHLLWAYTDPENLSLHANYSWRNLPGSWEGPEEVCPSCDEQLGVQMAMDAEGQPQVTWTHQWSDGMNWHHNLYYSRRTGPGSWTAPEFLSDNAIQPQIVIDHQGYTHIAWSGSTSEGLHHAYRNPDGSWHQSDPIYSQLVASFTLLLDKQGAVHLIFPNGYTQWMGGPQWSPIIHYGGSDQQVDVHGIMDILGGVHVLWSEAVVSSSNLVYVAPQVVDTPGTAGLAQTIVVSDTLINPTLSFLSATGGVILPEGSTFSVTISNGITTTLVYSSTGWSAGWQHHSADLNPWAGQAITLTFSLAQPAGYPDAWAYVDEVALGSVYPDPWVSLEGGALTALPGDAFSYQILYGNHGMVDSPGTAISLTLPDGLSFVEASIPPEATGDQLTWELGMLTPNEEPAPISLTVEVEASAPIGSIALTQVSIHTASPELEALNNISHSETYLGALFYLPILLR